MKSFKKLLLVVVLIALIIAAIAYFRDTAPPQVALTPASGPVSPATPLNLLVRDEGTGLKEVDVYLVQGELRVSLSRQEFPAPREQETIELSLEGLRLREGAFTIEVTATDQAIYRLGKGNTAQEVFELIYDSRPPAISVISRAHNFTRGGAGLVTYSLDEPVKRTGVVFGEHFFPAFQQPSGMYVSAVTFPYHLDPKEFVPRIVAVDLADNERQAGIYYRANNQQFRQRQINISDSFLDMTLPEFTHQVPKFDTPLETFLYINQQIRKENRAAVAALAAETAGEPLWEGVFLRQPRAAPLALFADHRTYLYKGKEIDRTVHLGYDLASIAQDDIVAANTGKVVFSDFLGIYGLCIVIDHGIGIQTLYAHLSQSQVEVGQQVRRGDVIGRSGVTGLAGGDHLHFEVLVNGIPVQPIEWWDANWQHNNIDSKLQVE
ncbi:MAG: M23 family metallopeptidase [Desulfuromonadales bacterium]|nr:M23 family metallopeptidase [Desulfuromonadales bacterium]